MNLTNWLMASALFMTAVYCTPTGPPLQDPGTPGEGLQFFEIPEVLKHCVFRYLSGIIRPGPDGAREFSVKQWIDALDHCGAYEGREPPKIDESSPALKARWQIPELDAKYPYWDHEDYEGGRGWLLSESRLLPAPGGGNDKKGNYWTKTMVDHLNRIGRSTLNRFGSAIRQNLHLFGNPRYKIGGPTIPARMPLGFSY